MVCTAACCVIPVTGLVRRKEALFEGTSQWQGVRRSLSLIDDDAGAARDAPPGASTDLRALYSDVSYVTAGHHLSCALDRCDASPIDPKQHYLGFDYPFETCGRSHFL